jgi:hypothetical protein
MRHEAIYNTYPNVKRIDDGLGAFDENGNSVTIDEAKVAEEVKRLEAQYEANQYQRDRASQYPSIQDQLDMQYHDLVDGTTTWKDSIAKVKADNPKPE